MSASGRIMVSYIATDGGIDALRLAVAMAAGNDLAIDIVMAQTNRAVTPGEYPHVRGFDTILERQLTEWLADARAEVPEGTEVATHVAVGDSVPRILLDTAEELGAGMLVVGSQGGGLFKRMSLGSVVNTLLHSSPKPVAIAPRGYNFPGPMERVTVMFGSRPGATDIIAYGLEKARRGTLPLRFVSLNIAGEKPAGQDAINAIEHSATADLATQARTLVDAGRATAEVVDAPSIEAATAQLDWMPGDLMCVGSARVAAEGRLFLGSTAAQIMRYTPAPTVVIPVGYMAQA